MKKVLRNSLFAFILSFVAFFGTVMVVDAAVTVKFDPQNGQNKVNLTLNVGQSIPLLNNIYKTTGYEIEGWYDHPDWVMGQKFETAPASYDGRTLNLYARWILSTYTIDYELDGGTVDGTNPTTYHYKDNPTLIINPTKDGYNFIGWTGTDLDEPTMQLAIRDDWTGDRSYTANYELIEYSIDYDLDGGVATNPTSYNIESNDITLNAPTKDGYEFIGWTGSNGDKPEKNVTISSGSKEDKSYKANYLKKIKLIIRYRDNQGNEIGDPTTIDYLEGEHYVAPEPIEINGYVINTSKYPTNTEDDFGKEDIYVDYYYDGLYDLSFETNGGTSLNTQEDIKEGTEINLADYKTTREGYTFAGWYSDKALTKKITSLVITEDVTVYAKWIKNEPKNINNNINKGIIKLDDNVNNITNNPNTGDDAIEVFALLIASFIGIVGLTKFVLIRKNKKT